MNHKFRTKPNFKSVLKVRETLGDICDNPGCAGRSWRPPETGGEMTERKINVAELLTAQ